MINFFIDTQSRENIILFLLLIFLFIINLLIFYSQKKWNINISDIIKIFSKYFKLYTIIYIVLLLMSFSAITFLVVLDKDTRNLNLLNDLYFYITNLYIDPIKTLNSLQSLKIKKSIFIIIVFNSISTIIITTLFTIKISIEKKVNVKIVVIMVILLLSIFNIYNRVNYKSTYHVEYRDNVINIGYLNELKYNKIFANDYIIKYNDYKFLNNKNIESLTYRNQNYVININSISTLIDKLLINENLHEFFKSNQGKYIYISNYDYMGDYDLTIDYYCNAEGKHDLKLKAYYFNTKGTKKDLRFNDYVQCGKDSIRQQFTLNLPLLPQNNIILVELEKSESYNAFIKELNSSNKSTEYNILSIEDDLYENINNEENHIDIYSVKDITEINFKGEIKEKLDLIYLNTNVKVIKIVN